MRSILCATGLALALALGGCRPPAGEAASPPHAAYRGPLASSLMVETLGDTARLVLQVTNGSSAPVSVTFPSGQSYDFAVMDGSESVWRWSADRSFLQAVRTVTLAPGQTESFAEAWPVTDAQRGRTLTAVAWLTSSDHPLEHRAQFRLP